MKFYTLRAIRYTLVLCLIGNLLGCDSFVRKFTRKSKNANDKTQELVLSPEEYRPPKMSKEEAYRKYFLYWKSWHDELINALSGGISNKKQLDCADQAIINLEGLRKTLQEAQQKALDVYIRQLSDLKDDLKADAYGNNMLFNRMAAERIKRNILRDFSYDKIKSNLA